MDIFTAKSISELKTCGKLKDVREQFKSCIDSSKFKTNTWANMFESIKAAKEMAESITGKPVPETTQASGNDPYFKGEAERYIFFLLEMDGEARKQKLKINRLNYSDKAYAKKWKDSIAKIVHPDNCKHPLAEAAYTELTEMYKGMIKR